MNIIRIAAITGEPFNSLNGSAFLSSCCFLQHLQNIASDMLSELYILAEGLQQTCYCSSNVLQQQHTVSRRRLTGCSAGFRPLYKVLKRDMNSRETLFAGLAGLRGSVSLILAQAVVTEDGDEGSDSESQVSFVMVAAESMNQPFTWLFDCNGCSPLAGYCASSSCVG